MDIPLLALKQAACSHPHFFCLAAQEGHEPPPCAPAWQACVSLSCHVMASSCEPSMSLHDHLQWAIHTPALENPRVCAAQSPCFDLAPLGIHTRFQRVISPVPCSSYCSTPQAACCQKIIGNKKQLPRAAATLVMLCKHAYPLPKHTSSPSICSITAGMHAGKMAQGYEHCCCCCCC